MKEVRAAAGSPERSSLAACVATVLELAGDEVPVPSRADPLVAVREWLAARGLGLVPVADAHSFSRPGYWLAYGRPGGEEPVARWVVMFGVPSGPVWDPLAARPGEHFAVERGLVLAALDPAAEPAAAVPPGTRIHGRVEAVFVAPDAESPCVAVNEAVALPGAGLEGDRYARGAGTFSHPDATGTELTLVEAEALDDVVLPDGSRLPYEQARRNVVTRGIDLDALVGEPFAVGDVRCVGRRRCEPCSHLQRLTRPGVLRAFVHRGGLRADILSAGTIAVGDPVRSAAASSVPR